MAAGLPTGFAGRRGRLFRLALRTGLFTILTLGFYRFWMKTRLRRYYWSSVRPGGHPLEYVGEPIEKLLGFLVAVVILSFYIGVVNLILMYLSFALLHGNVTAYALSFLGVIPIWFYAMYRARRYTLARTRWRGLRFGVDAGAWGYAGRALFHWAVTILTLGLLWPRMTFWLEKYKVDRTWFGTFRLHQGGDWRMLWRPFVPLLLSGLAVAIGLVMMGGDSGAGGTLLVLGATGLLPAIVHYRVQSRKLLANQRTAGPLGIVAEPRSARVFGIYAGGYALILLCLGGLILAGLVAGGLLVGGLAALAFDPSMLLGTPVWLSAVTGIAAYFGIFLLWGVLGHVFITLPLWRHYAETLTVTGTEDLSSLRQRGRDVFRDAEGFAEALDLGAAI